MLGLCRCTPAFSSCSEQGLLLVVEHGFSLRWLPLLQITGSRCTGFSSVGLRHPDMWDLPGPGIKPTSPALPGGFLTPGPPGKPHISILEATGLTERVHRFISSRGEGRLRSRHRGKTARGAFAGRTVSGKPKIRSVHLQVNKKAQTLSSG